MSVSFNPDPGVFPQPPYGTVFLSQRDLSINVPINYVTVPGVSLTAACFSHGVYEEDGFASCISNLLVSGFRRIVLDLYWDSNRRLWSFCPASIPTSLPSTLAPTSSSAAPTGSSTGAAISSGMLTARQVASQSSSPVISASSSGTNSTASSTYSAASGTPTVILLPNSANEALVLLGPYQCSPTLNLAPLFDVLWSYIQGTENTLGAHLLYMVFNVHSASNTTSPDLPSSSPAYLPSSSETLSSIFGGNLSTYTYTPENLQSDRANLNASWFVVAERYRPAQEYYNTSSDANSIFSTEDGWPSESYIEFSKSKRLLLEWGSIDPQMSDYNFTADLNTIFQSGYLQSNQSNVTVNTAGRVTNGCYILNNTADLTTVNSSWASVNSFSNFHFPSSSSADLTPTLTLASNLTHCGLSPFLNNTLYNSTAHENYVPYQNYSLSTVWSWAPGEPQNFTSNDSGSDALFRCATVGDAGWTVADCSSKNFAACQAVGQPYNWTITTYEMSYSFASEACDPGYTFAAPRTSLENSYLYQAKARSGRDFTSGGLWVDFNSLDVRACWVSGGSNATCPYSTTTVTDNLRERTILVPTIAAILVLIVTALTVFSKAAGNRKVRKRTRRRANNGFVYEGVPS